jgi:hypothetical protein
VRRVQELLDSFLQNWEGEALSINIYDSSPDRFAARLAQYEFQSIEALKEKVSQFPSGTKFILAIPPQKSLDEEDQTVIDLRAFLAARAK